MFAVIFEVRPRPERWEEYLSIARMLRPELERIEGFVENTRYRSTVREGVLLSLSLWRDEKALIRWRTHAGHFAAQARGREAVLADYRLRVGEVAALWDGGEIALPAQRLDVTDAGDAKALAFAEGAFAEGEAAMPTDAMGSERFTALLEPSATLTMAGFGTEDAARAAIAPGSGRRFAVRVIRDYGLRDRREAPQYHVPVDRAAPRAMDQ